MRAIHNAGTFLDVFVSGTTTFLNSVFGDANHKPGTEIALSKDTEPSLENDMANKLGVRNARSRFLTKPKMQFVLVDPQSIDTAAGYEGFSFIDAPGKAYSVGGDLRDINAYNGGAPDYGRALMYRAFPGRKSPYTNRLSNPGRDHLKPPVVSDPQPAISKYVRNPVSSVSQNRGKAAF